VKVYNILCGHYVYQICTFYCKNFCFFILISQLACVYKVYISVPQSITTNQPKVLAMTDFFSKELKYIPCIHTPTGMFNIRIINASQACIHGFKNLKRKLYNCTKKTMFGLLYHSSVILCLSLSSQLQNV
jgi:hypothetical protein